MSIFVDTSAFLAIINANDRQHQKAAEIWKTLIDNEETLICSNYILVETAALIQNRFGINALEQFQKNIVPLLQIVWVAEAAHQAGMSKVLESNRRQLSLVDCTSFEVMRSHNIQRIFCFDPHFTEQSFEILQ